MKKRLTLLLLILPCWALAQPNPTIRAFQAERLFLEGRAYYDQGDFVSAIDRFNEVVALDPNHEMVYEFRGEAFYALDDYQHAIEDYAIAAQQHPQNAEIRNSLGVASANLGLYDAAYSYFYEALQLDPSHDAARENLAIAERRRQQATNFTPNNGNNWTTNGQNVPAWNDRPNNGNIWNPQPNPTPGWQPQPNPTPGWQPQPNPRPNPQPDPEPERPALPRTYNRNQVLVGQQSDPYLKIEQVKVTQSGTQITFSIEGVGKKPYPVNFDKAGGANALYLTDRFFRKTFRLRNIRSLQGWPTKPYMLRPGEKKIFVAEFEKIDDDMSFFHILEGNQDREGAWEFFDVELKD